MILQEEFQKNGYKNLVDGEMVSEYEIDLEDIFDLTQKPKELLSIYISEQGDELFFLLDGDIMEINSLCDQWDDRIRIFTIINGKAKVIQTLKYNIVQLILYSNGTPDKNREGNLSISRKIIIHGDMKDRNQIMINNDEAIELPFHMITTDEFLPNENQMNRLRQLLPTDDNLLELMTKEQIKVQKKERNGKRDKSFAEQDFEKIKEWLEG